MNVEGLQ